MREVTQEIKDLIRQQVINDLIGKLKEDQALINKICKIRENAYANTELEVE